MLVLERLIEMDPPQRLLGSYVSVADPPGLDEVDPWEAEDLLELHGPVAIAGYRTLDAFCAWLAELGPGVEAVSQGRVTLPLQLDPRARGPVARVEGSRLELGGTKEQRWASDGQRVVALAAAGFGARAGLGDPGATLAALFLDTRRDDAGPLAGIQRLYRAIGGDADSSAERRRARDQVARLLLHAWARLGDRGGLSALAEAMIETDAAGPWLGHPAGTLERAIRWALEQPLAGGRLGRGAPALGYQALRERKVLWCRAGADASRKHQPPRAGQRQLVYLQSSGPGPCLIELRAHRGWGRAQWGSCSWLGRLALPESAPEGTVGPLPWWPTAAGPWTLVARRIDDPQRSSPDAAWLERLVLADDRYAMRRVQVLPRG